MPLSVYAKVTVSHFIFRNEILGCVRRAPSRSLPFSKTEWTGAFHGKIARPEKRVAAIHSEGSIRSTAAGFNDRANGGAISGRSATQVCRLYYKIATFLPRNTQPERHGGCSDRPVLRMADMPCDARWNERHGWSSALVGPSRRIRANLYRFARRPGPDCRTPTPVGSGADPVFIRMVRLRKKPLAGREAKR